MDFSSHSEKFPPEIHEYFASSWDKHELWRLELPRSRIPVDQLVWHLDYPFWSTNRPAPLFDLKPRTVLEDPDEYTVQWSRILAADLRFPIDTGIFGNRRVILDGFHRLLKSIVTGATEIECRLVPGAQIHTVADRGLRQEPGSPTRNRDVRALRY
jgi:hypothetical protein